MTNLQIIKSENFGEVRTDIYSNGNDMFMTALQLGECLGYSDPIRNISRVVSRNNYLENNEFSVVVKLTTTDGKAYDTRIFTEDGIYEITMLSRTKKAKEFRSWVRGVLRSVRKHGMYATEELLGNPEFAIATFTRLRDEMKKRKQLEIEVEENKQKMIELKPKIEYIDNVLSAKNTMTVSQIAADYGLSAQKLNEILHKEKVQYKVGGQWVLYRDKADKDYTKSITYAAPNSCGGMITNVQTRWTQKGRYFIDEILNSYGICAVKKEAVEVV